MRYHVGLKALPTLGLWRGTVSSHNTRQYSCNTRPASRKKWRVVLTLRFEKGSLVSYDTEIAQSRMGLGQEAVRPLTFGMGVAEGGGAGTAA